MYSISSCALDAAKTSDAPENDGKDGVVDEEQVDNSILKLTKAEKRAKLKKIKKVAKKQEELTKAEEVQPTPQAAVLVFFNNFTFLLIHSTVP